MQGRRCREEELVEAMRLHWPVQVMDIASAVPTILTSPKVTERPDKEDVIAAILRRIRDAIDDCDPSKPIAMPQMV